MIDKEKVITDITSVVADMQEEVDEWKDYSDSELSHGLTCDCDWWYKALQTLKDALALLKAQEPRLVTESDFDGADEYGYIPVWTEEKDGDMYWECIPKVAITCPDGIVVLRYWTSCPTDEQREATPWN